jgi:hypothetical protein
MLPFVTLILDFSNLTLFLRVESANSKKTVEFFTQIGLLPQQNSSMFLFSRIRRKQISHAALIFNGNPRLQKTYTYL